MLTLLRHTLHAALLAYRTAKRAEASEAIRLGHVKRARQEAIQLGYCLESDFES